MHAKLLQSCLSLCDLMDCSQLGSSVHRDFSGRKTGVCCHFLLRGNLPSDQTCISYVSALAGRLFTISATPVGSVQSLSHVQVSATPWDAACQASLSITNTRNLLKLMSIESVIPSNHLIPFSSCLQTFPASGSFPMNCLHQMAKVLEFQFQHQFF